MRLRLEKGKKVLEPEPERRRGQKLGVTASQQRPGEEQKSESQNGAGANHVDHYLGDGHPRRSGKKAESPGEQQNNRVRNCASENIDGGGPYRSTGTAAAAVAIRDKSISGTRS